MSPSFQPLGSKMTHSGNSAGGLGRFALGARVHRYDGVFGQRDPVVQVVVVALVDADAAQGHVGDDGGDLHALHHVAAVEVVALRAFQGLAQRGLVVPPVEQVPAADVLPAGEIDLVRTVGDLLQIAEVIAALPEDRTVDVVPAAFRGDEVVPRPVLVGDQLLAQLVGLHQVVVKVAHRNPTMRHDRPAARPARWATTTGNADGADRPGRGRPPRPCTAHDTPRPRPRGSRPGSASDEKR